MSDQQTTRCACLAGSTYGTADPAIRRCDLCDGIVPTDPVTGEYEDAKPLKPATCPGHRYERALPMSGPVPTTTPALVWRENEFGVADRALYLGRIYVGEVHDVSTYHPLTPWRGWVMMESDGVSIGMFATIEDAKAAVETAAREALANV